MCRRGSTTALLQPQKTPSPFGGRAQACGPRTMSAAVITTAVLPVMKSLTRYPKVPASARRGRRHDVRLQQSGGSAGDRPVPVWAEREQEPSRSPGRGEPQRQGLGVTDASATVMHVTKHLAGLLDKGMAVQDGPFPTDRYLRLRTSTSGAELPVSPIETVFGTSVHRFTIEDHGTRLPPIGRRSMNRSVNAPATPS